MRKWIGVILETVTLLGLAGLLFLPVRTSAVRLGIVFCFLVPLSVVIAQTWNTRHIGKVLLTGLVAVGGWIALTLSLTPPRAEYVSALRRYVGTPYVWGGETRRGIDCSGVIRMGLRDAYLSEWRLGAALRIWLVDSAAKDLPENYATIREEVGPASLIRELDATTLPVGCIAVTTDGVHTLAYLGDGDWIQASPDDGVVIIKPATAPDRWFQRPVLLYRWKTVD